MKKYNYLAVWVAFAILISSFLMWLPKDFRLDGFLGMLQEHLMWLYVIPYLLGVFFGDNPHNPNMVVFSIGLFAEVLLIVLVIRYFFTHKKTNSKKETR